MARAKSLGALLTDLRAETGQSLNVALGVQMRDTLVRALQAAQEDLYATYDWPFLKHSETVMVSAGSYVVSIPATLDPDRITHVYAREGAAPNDQPWRVQLEYLENPGVRDPGEGDQAETLPSLWWFGFDPATNITTVQMQPRCTAQVQLKLSGYRPLLPFVDDAHTCTLDGRAIVLAAAADILTNQGAKNANSKEQRFRSYLSATKANNMPRRSAVMIGGGGTPFGGATAGIGRRFRIRGVD